MSERSRVPLEDVFKTVGIPTYTFVEPLEYNRLLAVLRTPGRSVIVEGPSGIGKTTSVVRGLSRVELANSAQILKARKPQDVELISTLPEIEAHIEFQDTL